MTEREEASLRAPAVLARALLFFRIGGLVQVGFSAWVDVGRYRHPVLVLALVAAVTAESAVLAAAALRRADIRAWWVAADTVFCAGGLIVGAYLTAPVYAHTWAYFMYPFTIVTSLAIGFTFRRLGSVLFWINVLAGSYLFAAIRIHGDPAWNAVPNMLTYYPNVIVAWAVTRVLRHNGDLLDSSRAAAIARASELAQERERARHSRILHDRVLQTMEALARGGWIADPELVAHVSGEAAWLRSWLEGSAIDDHDLLAGLQQLVQRKARTGLQVELNSTALRTSATEAMPGPEAVAAVLQATTEALTNVAKHAHVNRAVVRVSTGNGSLVVSVLDHGCGFDADHVLAGTGLRESVQARIAEVDGEVRIESAPGAGTYVELRVPLRS